jgi:vancomycin aglycone glucosyltransferase
MRVLLSTVGSRCDVQRLVAGIAVEELGQEGPLVRPPDFRDWVDGLGVAFVPIGPGVAACAQSIAAAVRSDGAQVAAQRLIAPDSRSLRRTRDRARDVPG